MVCIGAILTEILFSRNPQSDHVTCVLCPRLWIFRLLNCGKASCQLTPFLCKLGEIWVPGPVAQVTTGRKIWSSQHWLQLSMYILSKWCQNNVRAMSEWQDRSGGEMSEWDTTHVSDDMGWLSCVTWDSCCHVNTSWLGLCVLHLALFDYCYNDYFGIYMPQALYQCQLILQNYSVSKCERI